MAEPYAGEHDGYIAHYETTREARAIGRIRTVMARRKNGEIFPIELSVAEVREGGEVRYGAFLRDISDKVRLQKELVENERLAAIGATASRLAHEIGNPLSGMHMTAQLLLRQLTRQSRGRDEPLLATVQNLLTEIRRLDHLLQDFGALSRRKKYHFQPTEIAAVVSEVLQMEAPRYAELGVQVEKVISPGLPLIVADSERLKQAVWNLCKNAVEAMPNGGTLTVRAVRLQDQILLEVADTGTGIPDGVDIFEPFNTTKASGTGLGLVIVRQIVAAHGGAMTYESEPGKSTLFRLALPLHPPSPPNPS
jgi:two-component system sensor kinase FixL